MAALGCQASVSAKGSANAETGAEADVEGSGEDRDMNYGDPGEQAVSAPPLQIGGEAGPGGAMLGARHDLRVAASVTQQACTCLAVALGGAGDARFSWLGAAPKIDTQSQLVIALSSEGMSCKDEPAGSLGASYWGYRWNGDDVVVVVEPARFGRPITTGAIIPKPVGQGKVYIQPHDASVPYGRPLNGGGQRCLIGNPGPPRNGPVRAEEMPAESGY
jgi:hypothetical protein